MRDIDRIDIFCDPKSKDCKIFKNPIANEMYIDHRTSEWDAYDDDFVYDRIYISYCPWCGRKV